MTTELILAVASVLGGIGGIGTMVWSRRKLRAEGISKEADAVETYNRVILRQLDYLDGQLASLRETLANVEVQVHEYRMQLIEVRAQLQEATRTESALRIQLAKAMAYIKRLRDFILTNGLEPPEEADEALT